ncbi:WxL protein host-binding domain-containing protein, partial [Peribacillus frigoritolerans]|uniref:WxL protein host-binding domain-containing protein n=1 Tax=Peribacillus frigoritolerans TaxID=450367 RepID=UPI002023FBCB
MQLPEIVIPGKETKKVPFTIQMPKESFDGIILGGFYVHEVNKEEKKKENNKVQIKNEFSYVIGVKLTGTDEVVKPKLKLNEVQEGLMNYLTVIT